MLRGTMRRALAASMLAVVLAQGASADVIQIQLGDVDLRYDGTNITDLGTPDPDPLTNATFLLNSVELGADITDVTLDLFIPGVPNMLSAGDQVNSAANGTLYLDLGGGEFLSLVLDSASITYTPATATVNFVFIGSASSIVGQQLPYSLLMANPVSVTFSTQTSQVNESGGFVTGFVSTGTGEIQYIPEPAALGLLAIGGLALLRRRRR